MRPPLGSWSFHVALTGLGVVLAAWVAWGMPWLVLEPGPLLSRLALLGLILVAAAGVWGRHERLSDALFALFWSLTLGLLYLPPMYAAARTDAPLLDARLAAWDEALGLTTPDFAWVAATPASVVAWALYRSVFGVMALGVLAPALAGRPDRSRAYVTAAVLAAVVAIALSGRYPAVGPWTVYPLPVDPTQARVEATLHALRAGGPFVADVSVFDGIIAIPSFHTILAVLAAWAAWPLRQVRWVAVAWAAGVTWSTLGTGWHFVSDVLAGLVFSAAAATVAGRISRPPSP